MQSGVVAERIGYTPAVHHSLDRILVASTHRQFCIVLRFAGQGLNPATHKTLHMTDF